MPQLSTADIKHRFDAAWKIKEQWKSITQEAYEMVFPWGNPYVADTKSPRAMNRQFDSTATRAVTKLANRIIMEMTPPDQNWVDIKPGPLLEMQLQKEEIDQIKPDLAKGSTMLNMVMNSGALVAARSEAMMDMGMSGLGVILSLDDLDDLQEPVNCQSVPSAEVAIDVDAKGRVAGVYRRRKIKVREIKNVWPDAVIPSELLEQKGLEKDPEIEVMEVTYKGSRQSNVGWYYEVLYNKSGNEPIRMVEDTYATSPWSIFRWMKIPGYPYGPGPVLLNLADIRTANKVMEMILVNAALALSGMYMVRDDGVINPDNITIMQGGMIPVQSTGGTLGPSIAPLGTNREFNIGQIVLEKIQTAIKNGMYDNSLPPLDGSTRSPTEIIQRTRELTQDIGGAIGRLSDDFIEHTRSVAERLQKRGYIFQAKIDQYTLKIQINSPLVKSQQLSEVQNVVEWIQMVIGMGGQQAALTVAHLDKVFVWIAERMGVPQELILSEEERAAQQENMAKIVAMGGQQASATLPVQAA